MPLKRKTSAPKPPKGKAELRKEEEREDELEVFQRRAEWFRELHTDRQGCLPPKGRDQALDQAAKLGRTRLRELDPGVASKS